MTTIDHDKEREDDEIIADTAEEELGNEGEDGEVIDAEVDDDHDDNPED